MATNFDTLNFKDLVGTMNVQVIDTDETPNLVLEIARPWRIEVDWVLHGINADTIGGSWELMAYYESMGPQNEGKVIPSPIVVPMANTQPNSTSIDRRYRATINVDPGLIKEEGIYKLVTLVTYKNLDNKPRAMAGFSEYPLITFYQAT